MYTGPVLGGTMLRRRVLSIFLLSALFVANNLHLPLLQVVAWTGMLASYSRDYSVAEALDMTFGGEHPCPMCKSITKARAASAGDAQLNGLPEYKTRDLCFTPLPARASLPPAFTHQFFQPVRGRSHPALVSPPPTPPPIRA